MILEVVNGRYLNCESEDCPFQKECAQHDSAGDFRSESGFSPDLEKVDEGYRCKTRDAEIDMERDYGVFPVGENDLNHGVLSLKNGKLVSYDPWDDE